MTKLLLVFFLLLTVSLKAQDSLESFSYYFNTNQLNTYTQVNTVQKKYFGSYNLVKNDYNQMRVTAGDELIIDEHGVYIAKNNLLSISRETIREDSRYRVKNGFLFGVTNADSIPTFLQNESYYFLMPTKAFLFDSKSSNQKMYKINEHTYIVFTKEDNGYYSTITINIKLNTISLSELDLSYNQSKTITHTEITENGIKTFILAPSVSDLKIILSQYETYDKYILKK